MVGPVRRWGIRPTGLTPPFRLAAPVDLAQASTTSIRRSSSSSVL